MCLCVLVCVLITSLSLFVVAIVYLSLIIMIITIFYHHKPTQIYIIYKSSKLVFIWSLLSLFLLSISNKLAFLACVRSLIYISMISFFSHTTITNVRSFRFLLYNDDNIHHYLSLVERERTNERRVYLISLFGDLEGVGLKMIKNYYIFDTIIKSSYIYIYIYNISI